MGIVAITGERRRVDHELVAYALQRTPSLIVDCANVCDVTKWFSRFPDADLERVFVYEMEMLYKFRDALQHVKAAAEERAVKTIVVTSMSRLFHYQNAVENSEVYCHAWETLKELGETFDVRVSADSSAMLRWARRYRMETHAVGHVVASQRQNLEQMISELERYAKALRPAERELFHDLLRVPMRHVGPVSAANSLHAWSFLLLSIMVEQEKRIKELEAHACIPHRRLPDERQHRLVAQN